MIRRLGLLTLHPLQAPGTARRLEGLQYNELSNTGVLGGDVLKGLQTPQSFSAKYCRFIYICAFDCEREGLIFVSLFFLSFLRPNPNS